MHDNDKRLSGKGFRRLSRCSARFGPINGAARKWRCNPGIDSGDSIPPGVGGTAEAGEDGPQILDDGFQALLFP